MYYSLHQRLTKILSTYLEFDAEQLELGLWNGDLHIKDGVNLHPSAFAPFLGPLNLQMLSGSVKKLHAQIPWNTLVDGSKLSVHLSDINIVLGFMPNEFAQDFGASTVNPKHKPYLSSRERELKRERIEEAEQRLYKDADNLTLQEFIERTKSIKSQPKRGFINQMLYRLASTLAWRLASSFHAKIERLRVTLVQDGISVGISLDALNITNGFFDGQGFNHKEESSQARNGGKQQQNSHSEELFGSQVNHAVFISDSQTISKRLEIFRFGVFIIDLRPQWLNSSGTRSYPILKYRTQLENLYPTESDYLILPSSVTLLLNLGFIETHSSPLMSKNEEESGGSAPLSATVAFTASFKDITFAVSSYQHRCLREFIFLSRQYMNGRPSCSVCADQKHPFHLMFDADGAQCYKPRRSIQQWWQYAFRCVVRELRQTRRGKYSWQADKKVREAYISAFTNSFSNSSGGNVKDALTSLEDALSIEQIILYRTIARYRVHGSSSKANFQSNATNESLCNKKTKSNDTAIPRTNLRPNDLFNIPTDDLEIQLASFSQKKLVNFEKGMLFRFHCHLTVQKMQLVLRDNAICVDCDVLRVALEGLHLSIEGDVGQPKILRFCIARLMALGSDSIILATDPVDNMDLFLAIDAEFPSAFINRDVMAASGLFQKVSNAIELEGKMGKVIVTFEERKLKGIMNILGDLGETFRPVSVLQDNYIQERFLRIAFTVINCKNFTKNSNELEKAFVWNLFLSFHGMDIEIPVSKNHLSDAGHRTCTNGRFFHNSQDAASLHFTFERAELTSGSFLRLDDVMQRWGIDASYSTSSGIHSPRFRQQTMQLGSFVSKFPKDLYRHFNLWVKNIRLDFANKSGKLVHTFRYPVHLSMLLSFSVLFAADDYPCVNLFASLSPVIARLSEPQILLLLSGIQQVCDMSAFASKVFYKESSRLVPSMVFTPPRLMALANYFTSQVNILCDAVHIAIIGEEPNFSMLERDLVFQEALNDFLSHYSCFEKNINAVECAKMLCTGRLRALGMHEDVAKHCIQQAQQAFIEALRMIKHVEQIELIASQEFSESPLAASELSSSVMFYQDGDSFVSPETNCNFKQNESGSHCRKMEDMHQTIETSISNAVERVISSLLPSIDFYEIAPNRELLVIEIDHLQLCRTSFYYDCKSIVEAVSLSIRNGNGIYFAKVACENACRDYSMKIVVVEKDEGHDFGCGGIPLEALQSARLEAYSRQRQTSLSLFLQLIELVCHPKDVESATSSLASFLLCLNPHHSCTAPLSNSRRFNIHLEAGEVKTLSLVFTANDLTPVFKLLFQEVSAAYFPTVGSCYGSQLTIAIQSVDLFDVTTTDGLHSDIIAFTCSDSAHDYLNNIVIRFLMSDDRLTDPSLIFAQVANTQILFLQRFVNELRMFFLDEESHFYQVLHKCLVLFQGSPVESDIDTTLPTAVCVCLHDSSFIFPRHSASADLLALRFEQVKIMKNTTAKVETFVKNCLLLDTVFCPVSNVRKFRFSPTPHWNEIDPLNEEFFDCLPEEDLATQPAIDREVNDSIKHNFLMSTGIERPGFLAQFINLHIFTVNDESLTNTDHFTCSESYDVKKCGNIEHGALAYLTNNISGRNISSLSNDVQSILLRRWTAVTQIPLTSIISVDFTPRLKLSLNLSSTQIIMASSQLYLAFSIWFCNLQELPKAFPIPLPRLQESGQSNFSTDWPDVRSPQWTSFMSDVVSFVNFELHVEISELKWKCIINHLESNFKGISNTESEASSQTTLISDNFYVGLKCRDDGLIRCCMSASRMEVKDDSAENPSSVIHFRAGPRSEEEKHVRENDLFTWGLECGRHTLTTELPHAFQCSLFMTPNQWCSVNIGFDPVEGRLQDLSLLWRLNEYFGCYFKYPIFGHPYFSFQNKSLNIGVENVLNQSSENGQSCMNLDIHLWLNRLTLSIPGVVTQSPALLLKTAEGVFYRYTSLGYSLSVHEFCCKDLSVLWVRDFFAKETIKDSTASDQHSVIVDGLRLSASYSFDQLCNHTNILVRLPLCEEFFVEKQKSFINGESTLVHPVTTDRPFILGGNYIPAVNLGPHVCTVMISQRNLVSACEMLLNFAGVQPSASVPNDSIQQQEIKHGSRAVLMNVGGIRAILCDPVLATHLPLVSLSVATLEIQMFDIHKATCQETSIQVGTKFEFWAEYFSNTIRMFEPLIEPYKAFCLYEASADRGPTFIFQADSDFHWNVTGAALDVLDQAVRVFVEPASADGDGDNLEANSCTDSHDLLGDGGAFLVEDALFDDKNVSFSTETSSATHGKFMEKVPRKMLPGERVAYSLTNLTGQKICVVQPQKEMCLQLSYINNNECMELKFDATFCAMRNMIVQEIPFEALFQQKSGSVLKSSPNVHHMVGVKVPNFEWVDHIVADTDMDSLHGLQLMSCPRFYNTTPLSSTVRSKIELDWRLSNALKLVSEISFLNGGRRINISSPFKIINMCTHSIVLVLHHSPNDEVPIVPHAEKSPKSYTLPKSHLVDKIAPSETYHIPFSLLESSLRQSGYHLGCFWICPEPSSDDSKKSLAVTVQANESTAGSSDCLIGFSSKAVQLSKLVQESSVLHELTGSGMEGAIRSRRILVSCPVFRNQKVVSTPPFFYVIEVKRSPFAASIPQKTYNTSLGSLSSYTPIRSPCSHEGYLTRMDSNPVCQNKSFDSERIRSGVEKSSVKKMKQKRNHLSDSHSPIFYSLIIHPPLVLENILPCGGTFELMHLNRRQVIWREYIEPGQVCPIYCVGLDTPLILLLNLGYCRTPQGQGALIHDGTFGGDGVLPHENQEVWTPISKVISEKKKNALSTIAEVAMSTDERALNRLAKIRNGRNSIFDEDEDPIGNQYLAEDKVDKQHKVMHSANDSSQRNISTETTLVDSLGQLLRLGIDNRKGDGGNRTIRIFCPYWIVNTTQHALRYKQEGCSSFIGGTYFSTERDGTKSVDGSRSPTSIKNCTTVFPGQSGALARAADAIELSNLISPHVSFDSLASLAFMFNFHERVRQKLSIQVANDDTYMTSNWSLGFSLESVGVSQVVAIPFSDGRALEISVSITVPPGNLSSYTKVVRLCPKYILINKLERPIRLWQDSSTLHSSFIDFGELSFNSDNQSTGKKSSSSDIILLDTKFSSLDRDTGISPGTLAHRTALYVTSVGPAEVVPFVLPDSRAERHLRFDFGDHWRLTSSIMADIPANYALKFYRALDPLHLRHATARKEKEYVITFPSGSSSPQDLQEGELGVWFEADYDKNEIIVKGTKRGKFSYTSNIQVGDQLLKVGEIKVDCLTFEETMKLVKEKLSSLRVSTQKKSLARSQPSGRSKSQTDLRESDKLKLTFRTFEERLRRERSLNYHEETYQAKSHKIAEKARSERHSTLISNVTAINVEISAFASTLFFTVKPFDTLNPPFFIENRSSIHTIFFRQRLCDGHPWTELHPGATTYYIWEDNLKPKKLTIRVGRCKAIRYESSTETATNSRNQSRGLSKSAVTKLIPNCVHFVEGEEQAAFGPSRTIKLEEIGFSEILPCPNMGEQNSTCDAASLLCRIDTKGETRVLIVNDYSDISGGNEKSVLMRHYEILKLEEANEKLKLSKFQELGQVLQNVHKQFNIESVHTSSEAEYMNCLVDPPNNFSSSSGLNFPTPDIEVNSVDFFRLENQIVDIADYPENSTITHRNQVMVEIIEAIGLNAAEVSISGLCNPYCEIKLKNSSTARSRGVFSKGTVKRTYYIEKTLSPKWCEQKFLFSVPVNASKCLRGYSVVVKVKSFGFLGVDIHLGQTEVQLYNIRNERELVGWFPLKNNTGESSVGRTCGSVRMRLQWIYTLPALLNHFIAFSECRLIELMKRSEGIQQHITALESQSKNQEYVNQIRWNTFSSLGLPMRSKNMVAFPGGNLPEKNPGQISGSLRRNYLGSLNLQTLQSKRKRISSYSAEISGVDQDVIIEENELEVQNTAERSYLEEDSIPAYIFDHQDGRPRAASDVSHNRFRSIVNKERVEFLFASRRTLSDVRVEIVQPVLYPNVISLPPVQIESPVCRNSKFDTDEAISLNETNPIGRSRFLTANEFSFSSQSSSCEDDKLISNEACLQLLFKRGLLYHQPGWSFRLPNWAIDVPSSCPLPDERESSTKEEAKSHSIFKSWLEVYNHFSTRFPLSAKRADREISEAIGDIQHSWGRESSQPFESGAHFGNFFLLPKGTPYGVKEGFMELAHEMKVSQNSIFSLYKRLLRSCLNPGGWLTIRPIMALNLPGNSTMRVKLKYGTLTKVGKAVNAPVNPSWSEDTAPNGASGEKVRLRFKAWGASYPSWDDRLKYQDPDFQLYVEPLKTCGNIRLSVIGGSKNSEVEFGIINIPIESAVQCCNDYREASETQDSQLYCSAESGKTYVRWFPLRNPKDCMPVDGDISSSNFLSESEKLSHEEFKSYAPCIKLAFLWEPDYDGGSTGDVAPYAGRSADNHTETANLGDVVKSFFFADVKGISISLIDSTRAMELLSVSLERLFVRYSATNNKTRMSATIGWIQIDHHNKEAREPVVVAPRLVDNLQPALVLSAMKDNLRSKKKIDTYEFVAFALQELDFRLDEVLLNDCWIFFLEYVRKFDLRKQVAAERFDTWMQIPIFRVRESVLMDKKKLYIEKLMLADIKFNLSYIKGFTGATLRQVLDDIDDQQKVMTKSNEFNELKYEDSLKRITRQPSNAFERDVEVRRRLSVQTNNGDFRSSMRFIYNLPNVISSVFPAISEAPIRLQGKIMDHVFESIGDIIASVKNYYASEALRQVYRIIGSLEVLGAPLDVFSHIATGVKDFFYEPSKAFMVDPMNPTLLGLGVAKGTLSLVSHSATGFFGFASKMISSGGYAVAALSLDNTYLQRRAKFIELVGKFEENGARPKSAKFAIAVARPFLDLLFGVTDAAAGVLLEPYKGAQKEGAYGLVKGASIGIVGVVTKPLAGVLDAFAHTAESITMFAKNVNILEKRCEPIMKRRISHPFGLHGSLRFFNMETARSAELLRMIPILDKEGRQTDEDGIDEVVIWVEVFHMAAGIDVYIIVSNHRIANINLRKEETGRVAPTLNWHAIFKGEELVTSRLENSGHGLVLYVSQHLNVLPGKSFRMKTKDSKHVISTVAETLRFEALLRSPTEVEISKILTSPLDPRRLAGGTSSAAPGRSAEKREAIVYAIQGNFHQRSQLLRIHNAISCINQNFDNVVHESGLGPEWSKDGITKFGPFEFSNKEILSEDETDFFPVQKNNIWWSIKKKSGLNVDGSSLVSDCELSEMPSKYSVAEEYASISPSATSLSLSKQQDMKCDEKYRTSAVRILSSGVLHDPKFTSRMEVAASSHDGLISPSCPSEILMVDKGDISQVASTIENETIMARLRHVEFLLEHLVRNQSATQANRLVQHSRTRFAADESRETIISNLSDDKLSTETENYLVADDCKEGEISREIQAIKAQCEKYSKRHPHNPNYSFSIHDGLSQSPESISSRRLQCTDEIKFPPLNDKYLQHESLAQDALNAQSVGELSEVETGVTLPKMTSVNVMECHEDFLTCDVHNPQGSVGKNSKWRVKHKLGFNLPKLTWHQKQKRKDVSDRQVK